MTGPPVALQRTPLFDYHRRHGGHLVPFAGWEMPLYYSSILAEHNAVRTSAGLFDVSHMGILTVAGGRATDLLGRRTVTNAEKILPGQVRYSFLLEASGGIVDDLLISRIDPGDEVARRFLVVPNAGRAAEVEEILRQHRAPDTTVHRWNAEVGLLALQGPRSRDLLESVFGWDLKDLRFYHLAFFPADAAAADRKGRLGLPFPAGLDRTILVSRTGYTGELGYELFVRHEAVDAIAERLLTAGAVPCGLGCRDTLRLEKGYLLSGQEFHRDHTPLEAAQDRFVELDHPFVGKEVLDQQHAAGPPVRLVGIEVDAPGAIPRHGTPVHWGEKFVTPATSGGLSPTLNHGIALAYLPKEATAPGTSVALEIRGNSIPGRVVPLPFVKAASGRG
ncbi:MAG TPA: glycine cleavage system aminomethyltransferase GcvT [Thermoplasmata archaeon]|nr:glycine cleavage system aminomethyltransferase GcvT [Thermoplasmata archaeon]